MIRFAVNIKAMNRDNTVYANCSNVLSELAMEAKSINLSNLNIEAEKIIAICETWKQYLATEMVSEDDEEKFNDLDEYFNEIKRSALLILTLPKEKETIRQYGIKLCSYARQKSDIILDTKFQEKSSSDDWLDRMI